MKRLTREGRWVSSAALLDRQVRRARKPDENAHRDWPKIVEDWAPDCAQDSGARDQQPPVRDENRRLLDQSIQILNVFERLWTEASDFAREAASVHEPAFEIMPREPEIAEAMRVQTEASFEAMLARRIGIGLDSPGAEEVLAPDPARQTTVPPVPLGHRVEVWASVSLKRMPGLVVGPRPCFQRCWQQLLRNTRSASRLLSQKPEVRDCFQWSGEEVARNRNDKGLPQYNGRLLAGWLNKAVDELCDCQNRPADILRSADGRLSLNPEYWGIWPGCDNTLHAWRQVLRMADVARIARRGESDSAKLQDGRRALSSTVEPNLTRCTDLCTYQCSSHAAVTSSLPDRCQNYAVRCLAAICVRRGGLQISRLRNYLLWQDAPLDIAAAEMFNRYNIAWRLGGDHLPVLPLLASPLSSKLTLKKLRIGCG